MKATFTKPNQSNARNYSGTGSGTKETVNTIKVVGRIGEGDTKEICEARFYMGRSRTSSTVYCALWVHAAEHYTSGRGTAGGGGYHKESAALAEAISSAGITLTGDVYGREPDSERRADIGGVGESAMREAMKAIAIAAGADPASLFVC